MFWIGAAVAVGAAIVGLLAASFSKRPADVDVLGSASDRDGERGIADVESDLAIVAGAHDLVSTEYGAFARRHRRELTFRQRCASRFLPRAIEFWKSERALGIAQLEAALYA